jgi:hypothetical protein
MIQQQSSSFLPKIDLDAQEKSLISDDQNQLKAMLRDHLKEKSPDLKEGDPVISELLD